MTGEVVPFRRGEDVAAAQLPAGFRSPPHNIDAEQALLGAILVNNLAYTKVAKFITPEHFYEPVHQRIYAACQRMIDRSLVADHVTIHEEFDQDEALRDLDRGLYLARLARSAETVMNAESYGQVLIDCWLRRRLIEVCETAANRAYDAAASEWGDEQMQMLRGDLDALARQIPAVEGPRSINDVVIKIIDRIEGLSRSQQRTYYSTGLKMLDGNMNGGLHRGEVYSFEARSEQFKTGLMGTLALNLMKQGVPILYCALEMGEAKIVERMISAEAGFNSKLFRTAANPQRLIDGAIGFQDAMLYAHSWWCSHPGMTFDRLRSVVGDCTSSHQVAVIFIDYWQLVGGMRKGQNKVEHLADVAQWMEQFAGQRDVVVVSASQTNREDQGLWGDGLFRASTWQKRLHKVTVKDIGFGEVEALWLEHVKDRHGEGHDIGDATSPALYIAKKGPVARDWGDW